MSIKMYDSYKIQKITLFEMLCLLQDLRQKYIRTCREYIHNNIQPYSRDHIIGAMFESIRTEGRLLNFVASCIVFIPEENSEDLYCRFFGIDPGIFILDQYLDKRFSDYSYWNDADPPKNFRPDLWERRGKFWKDLFGNKTFYECGFKYELFTKDDVFLVA